MSFSAFTSSMNSPEDLEAIFTARDNEARVVMEAVRDTATTGSAHNILMTGPRGIGKTHLISLTFYRVRDDERLAAKVRVAWLSEDPYRAGASYGGMLNEILDRLTLEYGVKDWPKRRREIQDLATGRRKRDINAREIEAALEREIENVLEGRALLILSENFDEILKGLGEGGQKRLRAFLQTRITAVLICTATSLTQDFSDREKTFYGFFRQLELRPFTFQDCLTVLTKMAEKRENANIAKMLGTAQGRARVRAIHHLAGGNPRVYVIFYEFLARNSLDELRRPFIELVDHLLPYYQGRMQTLSPAQRQYVDIIRTNYGPLAVKDVAREALTSHQSVSSDLGALAEMGYLISSKAGREVFYELREPLMRICLEAKEERGNSVPLFIDFLRIWFTSEELRHRNSPLLADYALYADQIAESEEDRSKLTARWRKQVREAREAGDLEEARVRQLAIYKERRTTANWRELRALLEELGEIKEMVDLLHDRAVESVDDGHTWNELSVALHEQKDFERSLSASAEAARLLPDDAIIQSNHLVGLLTCSRQKEAREYALALEKVHAFDDSYGDHYLKGIINKIFERSESAILNFATAIRSTSYWHMPSLEIFEILALEGADQAARNWSNFSADRITNSGNSMQLRIRGCYAIGEQDEALAILDALLEKNQSPQILANRFSILVQLQRFEEAEAFAERHEAAIFQGAHSFAFGWRGVLSVIRRDEDHAARYLKKWIGLDTHSNSMAETGAGIDLLYLVPDPEIWSRAAALFLIAHKHHDAVPNLGVALVHGILRPSSHRVPDNSLSAWVEIWRSHAKQEEALELPVKLMAVAAEVRRTKSRNPLLSLTVDQRSLLEPDVTRYLRFLGLEDHPLDAVIERTMAELAAFFEEENEQEEKAVPVPSCFVFDDPAPSPDPDRIAALLAPYHGRKRIARALASFQSAPAKALTKAEAREFVEHAWPADARIAHILAHPGVTTRRVDQWQTVAGKLFQLHLNTPYGPGALDLLEPGSNVTKKGKGTHETLFLLDGSIAPIELASEAGMLKPKKKDTHDYIAFFCAMLRADEGRFAPQDPADPAVRRALKAADRDANKLKLRPNTKGGIRQFPLLISYADHLFLGQFSPSGEQTWAINMLEDEQLTDELGWPKERFDGPLRLWAPEKLEKKTTKRAT